MSTDTTISPGSSLKLEGRVQLSRIDASLKNAGLFFLISAMLWLMVGTFLSIVSSYKLHTPDFMVGSEWMTYGRARAASYSVMIYGWANNAVYCLALWMMARLSRGEVKHKGLLVVSGIFWNVGVSLGILGILSGRMTSVGWLDFPQQVAPILVISYLLMGIWGISSFVNRKTDEVFVTQWYFLAALFWFPWIYTVAQAMILFTPARGVVQSVTHVWFVHNLFGLWLTPMALGMAYYLFSKVLGKPLHSYYLSLIGFWTLALFSSWIGIKYLIAGPVPVWLQSSGTIASVMFLIPVVVIAINWFATINGNLGAVWKSPTLRFTLVGAICFLIVSVVGVLVSFRPVSEVVQFTHFMDAHQHQGVYGFFTMIVFGAIYFAMPRFTQREWPSASLIWVHFWAALFGILVYGVGMSLGGVLQGLQLNDASLPFLDVMHSTVPWLASRTIAEILLVIAHSAFFINFFWMLLVKPSEPQQSPTLFEE